MTKRSTFPRRRRPFLSDDVQRRVAIHRMRSAGQTQLPFEGPRRQAVERRAADALAAGPATVQETEDAAASLPSPGSRDQSSSETGGGSTDRPNAEQIADRVYELMRQDLRLERERIGR